MLSGSKFLCLKISVFKLLPPSNYVLVGSQIWETFYLALLSCKWISDSVWTLSEIYLQLSNAK